ncbi:MAG: hypothetical protein IJF29_03310 [Firmicutes bacterium]|nr:hypothetical protein [Bacillota bacterium]
MNKSLFIVLNVVFFVFNFCVIRYLPSVIFMDWLPSHFIYFFGTAPIGSLLWGSYFIKFFKTQKDL